VHAWKLVTEDELTDETRALQPRSSPRIDVIEPDQKETIVSPVNIRLRFVPAGSKIMPGSFKAWFGWLEIDITSRLLEHAKIDASGLSAENAEIPAGQYRIKLRRNPNVRI
jgi:hypothetical protein